MCHFRSALLLCFLVLFSFVQSFKFTVNEQPTQCDPLSISWTGGQAPFRFIIVIPVLVNFNITIPDSNFRDNIGSFNLPALPVAENTEIFFAMSDSTGAISGGTSNLMTVGESRSRQSCSTTTSVNDFFFSTPDTLTQCNDFSFTKFEGAVKPITIFAFIPGSSDSLVTSSTPGADSSDWKANISAQTQVTFSVIDSLGRSGGSGKLLVVAPSDDNSCLLKTTVSSTSESQAASPTGSPGGPALSKKSNTLPGGVIAGLAIGGAIVIAILAVSLCWLVRRRRQFRSIRSNPVNLAGDFPQDPGLTQPMLSGQFAPSLPPSIYASQGINNPVPPFYPEPLRPPLPPSLHIYSQHYHENPTFSSTAASNSKLGSRTRFILHHDADDAEGPVELPPQYNDRRAPVPDLVQALPLQQDGQTKTG